MYEIALCFRLKPYIPPSTAAQPAAQETGFSWESVPVGSGGPCLSPQEGVGALDSFLRAAGKCLPRGSLSLNTSWFLALFSAFPLASCHRLWFLSGDLWGSQVLCMGQWRVLGGWAVNVPEQCWALQRRKKNRKELPLGSGSVWSDPKTRVLSFCQYFCLLWSRLQGGIFLHLNCIQECVSSWSDLSSVNASWPECRMHQSVPVCAGWGSVWGGVHNTDK